MKQSEYLTEQDGGGTLRVNIDYCPKCELLGLIQFSNEIYNLPKKIKSRPVPSPVYGVINHNELEAAFNGLPEHIRTELKTQYKNYKDNNTDDCSFEEYLKKNANKDILDYPTMFA